jgi:hypothetical protein
MSRHQEIDTTRARELRLLGFPWKLIGQQLAIEQGRKVAFQATSVQAAVRLAETPASGAH